MDYTELLNEFKTWVVSDSKCQVLWSKVNNDRASYKDAENYSARVAKWWSDNLVKHYGDADYSEVVKDISQSLKKAYSESAYYAKNVQGNINAKAKIGMKALEPHIDDTRITSLLEKLTTEDAKWLLDSDVVKNIARSAVTDTIQANARIQSEADLYSYIERDTGAGCCDWCESVAGRYLYGEQPDDFFRVHKDCTCSITYMPSKERWQKITYGSNRKKNVEYL